MSWDWIMYLVATVFTLLCGACLVLVVFQLPGAWIMLALAVFVEWVDQFYLDDDSVWTFSLPILLLCGGLAAVGEIIEFVAGLLGAKHGGASRRGMWGALIGGIAGAFVLQGVFFFIPIFGALFGALLGTFIGAIVGELGDETATVRGSVKPAIGATLGRIFGTVAKLAVAMAIWATLTMSAFWP